MGSTFCYSQEGGPLLSNYLALRFQVEWLTWIKVTKMSEVTGQLVMNCQSANVYCFLNTLHKLKLLSSCYSVGNHTSQYASQAQALGTKMHPIAPLKARLTQVQGPDPPGQAGAWNTAHAFLAYLCLFSTHSKLIFQVAKRFPKEICCLRGLIRDFHNSALERIS